ncbi:MAG: hypothetical protein GC162_16380 [Planctomycetes bacterium]|nr:hypothetical protein [Planctomycetota bacterium]
MRAASQGKFDVVTSGLNELRDAEAANRLRRRVMLFKRAGMVEPADNNITIKRAVTCDELKAAYKLVHDVFVMQNYILPQSGGMRLRIFEALPEMATFIAKVGDRVVGVMSVVPDSDELGLPSDRSFGVELNELRARNRRIGEVTNLAVASEYCKSAVLLELSRCICAHAVNVGLDDLFIAISPGHSGFFEAVLQFDPCGAERNYGGSTVDMVEGKRLDVTAIGQRAAAADEVLGEHAFLYDWFVANNPYLQNAGHVAAWHEKFFRRADVLEQLFGVGGELLAQCSPNHLQVLRARWGEAVFQRVFGKRQTAPVLAMTA